MRSINRIETFANGSIIAPCHLFSMEHDLHASTIYFLKISVKMTMLTGTLISLVVYIYLRRLLSFETLVHQAELFRHNWCVETEEKEEALGIREQNRLFDTSLLDTNIDDPDKPEARSPKSLTRTEDGDGEEEFLGLLPRDKLVAFPNPTRMRLWCYILLCGSMALVWILLLFQLTLSSSGYNARTYFSDNSFAFARMLEILKAHRRLMDTRVDLHKCFGTMEELKTSLSSAVFEPIRVFVWERSLAQSVVPIVVPVLGLAVLMELAVQGLYFSRLNHRQTEEPCEELDERPTVAGSRLKEFVYFYNVGNKFLLSFFVYTLFMIAVLMFEQYNWTPDREM